MSAFIAHAHHSICEARPVLSGWPLATQKLGYRGPAGTKELMLPGQLRLVVATRRNGSRDGDLVQPFVFGSQGIVIALDGRIHDPSNLAGRLGIRRTPKLPSDVELLARAYLRFGDNFLSHVRGEYALVVHDPASQRTLAARDTLGQRILYWAHTPHGTFISNELPAIRTVKHEDGGLDRTAIADFLLHGRMDFFEKSRSPFAGIHAVEPGCVLIVDNGRATTRRFGRFADLLLPVSTPQPAEIPEAFNALMREVVSERMDTNRVLIPLSGGLDSTTIAAAAMDCFRNGRGRAHPFAITALASSSDAERPFAELAAEHIGIDHSLIFLEYSQLLLAPEAKWYPTLEFFGSKDNESASETPIDHEMTLVGAAGDSLIFPERTSWIKLVSNHGLTHALYARKVLAQQRRKLPLGTGFGTPRERRGHLIEFDQTTPRDFPVWLRTSLIKELNLRERWTAHQNWRPPEPLHPERPNAQLWLQWANWFSTARPVNPRFTPSDLSDPFLDHRIISFVFRLPTEPWMHRKHLLRIAGKSVLPDALLNRPKSPAGNYIAPKIKEMNSDIMNNWSMSEELGQFVDRSSVPMIDIDKEGATEYINLRPLMLQHWFSKLGEW